MRDFHDCPPQALRRVRGVLTDIDDTLTREGHIEAVALDALNRFAQAGIPVIAITGRPAGWSEPFARAWPVRAIVAETGAVLLQRDGDELRHYFAQDAQTRASNFARLQACAGDVLARVPGTQLSRDSAGRLTDIAIDHSEFAHLDTAAIALVCAVMREHGLRATVSSIHVNGWIGTHSKWTAASWAVQTVLGARFDADEWLYVGDSTNDQPMFENIPLSIGVANIARFVPQLSALPAYVTRSERGEGFAEVARALLGARG